MKCSDYRLGHRERMEELRGGYFVQPIFSLWTCVSNLQLSVFQAKFRRTLAKLVSCRNPGSNQGHLDLQSNALPTELFRLPCTNTPRCVVGCLVYSVDFRIRNIFYSSFSNSEWQMPHMDGIITHTFFFKLLERQCFHLLVPWQTHTYF